MIRALLTIAVGAGVVLVGAVLAGGAISLRAQERPAAPLIEKPVQLLSPAAERGLAVSQQMCAECHAIERGRTASPSPEAPAFETIARTPGMGRLALRAFLYTPHRKMPNIVLSRDDADDVIDYILTLSQ